MFFFCAKASEISSADLVLSKVGSIVLVSDQYDESAKC